MEEINKLYNNDIGIAFQWCYLDSDITQLIFRDTGFHLSEEELEVFLEKIEDTKNQKRCNACKKGENCRSLLLQTPTDKVSLAISQVELNQIEDLIKGTLFQLELDSYVKEVCEN